MFYEQPIFTEQKSKVVVGLLDFRYRVIRPPVVFGVQLAIASPCLDSRRIDLHGSQNTFLDKIRSVNSFNVVK